MDLGAERDKLRRLCAEHLGAVAGSRLAALARPGFELGPARDDAPATGRCAVGGPALLEPGTPWPEYDGIPLSLLAVLDTDALAPWLGEYLPRRAGLLNIFILEPEKGTPYPDGIDFDDPRWFRVIPADPARAVERSTAAPASRFERIPQHARPILTLPDKWGSPVLRIAARSDRKEVLDEIAVVTELYEAWEQGSHAPADESTFGWPVDEIGSIYRWEDTHVHLLKLLNGPSSWPTIYCMIPQEAFRIGDFGQAILVPETY